MNNQMNKILEQIKALKEKEAELLPLRKDEIFNILEYSGGITLDNRLLAGLAIYANNLENKDSIFLKELIAIGSKKIPSKKPINKSSKASNIKNRISNDSKEEKSANG